MKLRSALLAATILALPAGAMAQPVSGLYVGAGVGPNYLMSLTAKSPTTSAKIQDSIGFAGLGSVGYGLGNGLRVELEGNFRNNTPKLRGTNIQGGGTVQTYGAMVNAIYDYNMGPASLLNPYAGVGVGYELTSLQPFTAYSLSGTPSASVKSTTKGGLGAQVILGNTFPIASVPGLGVTLEYRFLAVLDNQKFPTTGTAGNSTLKLNNQYNHSILVGLRYAFGVAPVPAAAVATAVAPTPVPAVVPARSYLVFFDWDKADLTARAQQIIAEAAQASTRVATTRIDVAGHADKSGTAGYNQGLSLKRANNVAAELVRLGVPRSAISITAFGDTKPLVPTAAGVREPQNRRVEIVLK
jgi:outer membrane protein OmpA-like peptidoglycan-associated protein